MSKSHKPEMTACALQILYKTCPDSNITTTLYITFESGKLHAHIQNRLIRVQNTFLDVTKDIDLELLHNSECQYVKNVNKLEQIHI